MEKNVPRLRFPEFEGEWRNEKLGNISKFSKGKGISKSEISESGKTECIRYGELYTHYNEVISKIKSKTDISTDNLVLSEENDIIIPASGETQIDIATASCVLKSGIALGGDLNIIKTSNNGVFLSYYLNNRKKLDIANMAQGISVVHLYSSQLAILKINLPSLPEQTKIANFLTAVDEKISALKKKKELLEQYKKGVMQQIFSQQLRFKDYNGEDFTEWEEKMLGEVALITIGEFVIKTKQNPNGKYPVYNGGKSYTGFYDEFNNEGEKVIISARGANAGFVNFTKERYWAGNSCYSIGIKNIKENNISYFYYFIKMFENRFLENQQAANIPSVSKKDAETFIIQIPSLPEQTKIANFLTAIDDKTSHCGKEIEGMETWKKGLLQQMFV